jgi:hypothetical protein
MTKKEIMLNALKQIAYKYEKSVLVDFCQQGPEGAKRHIKEVGKYYEGYNKCLAEVQEIAKEAIAKVEGG